MVYQLRVFVQQCGTYNIWLCPYVFCVGAFCMTKLTILEDGNLKNKDNPKNKDEPK